MAGSFTGSTGALAHLTPRPTQILSNDNYIPVDQLGFTQQYLPDVYEKEVERYGNRTVSGFLRMVGAEMPMTSDVVTWFEQGRLHIAYESVTCSGANELTLDIANDENLIIPGHTIAIADVNGLNVVKAYVTASNASTGVIALKVYGATQLPAAWIDTNSGTAGNQGATDLKLFVYGSEYAKGSQNAGKFVEAKGDFYSNKPIILREKYSVSGSNTAQIGWIEVTTEIGTSGYLWYLKSEHEARIRFEDQLEMAMIEAEPNMITGTLTPFNQATGYNGGAASGTEVSGSEGLFYAVEDRGLVYTDADFGAAAGAGLDDFDTILAELDKQGAIEENMLFLNRATSLGIDKMLAYQNSYGAGGTSYGVFENNENMALNLGFSGFRRGSYDFYKTDWKYLNNPTTRGLFADVEGVLVPAGVSTVYDQQLGTNIQRPFLHVRYRASEADDRRMKSWITGSVGGNYTSDEDAMNVHFLSERALCVQGANNFVMLKKATV
jgi:hypothetical protein